MLDLEKLDEQRQKFWDYYLDIDRLENKQDSDKADKKPGKEVEYIRQAPVAPDNTDRELKRRVDPRRDAPATHKKPNLIVDTVHNIRIFNNGVVKLGVLGR